MCVCVCERERERGGGRVNGLDKDTEGRPSTLKVSLMHRALRSDLHPFHAPSFRSAPPLLQCRHKRNTALVR